jgi:hypothetical protein
VFKEFNGEKNNVNEKNNHVQMKVIIPKYSSWIYIITSTGTPEQLFEPSFNGSLLFEGYFTKITFNI